MEVSGKCPEIVGVSIASKNAILDVEMIGLGENSKPSFSWVLGDRSLEDPLKIRLRFKMHPAIRLTMLIVAITLPTPENTVIHFAKYVFGPIYTD